MLLNVVTGTMTCPLVTLLRGPQSTAEGDSGSKSDQILHVAYDNVQSA